MDGKRPPSRTAPSTWYDALAPPHQKVGLPENACKRPYQVSESFIASQDLPHPVLFCTTTQACAGALYQSRQDTSGCRTGVPVGLNTAVDSSLATLISRWATARGFLIAHTGASENVGGCQDPCLGHSPPHCFLRMGFAFQIARYETPLPRLSTFTSSTFACVRK